MRYWAFPLSVLLAFTGTTFAQTGFTSQTYAAPSTAQLTSADINGDGAADIVTWQNSYGNSTTPASILYNNGQGGFTAPVALPGNFGAFTSLTVADMNGDSYPDIVGCYNIGDGASSQENIVVEMNNGGGNFSAKPTITEPGYCSQLVVGDVYRTGHLAVVTGGGTYVSGQTTANNTLYVFSNDGMGTLSLTQTNHPNLDSPTGTPSSYSNCTLAGVVGGDFKKSNSFDLVLSANCEPPQVQPYNPFGSTLFYAAQGFAPNSGYPSFTFLTTNASQLQNAQVADYNSDSYPDIIYRLLGLGYGGSNPYSVGFAQNDGHGGFSFQALSNVDSTGGFAAVGDFNGDGYNDLAITSADSDSGYTAPPTVTIYSGSPNDTFTQSSQATIGSNSNLPGAIIAADLTHDGKLDLATLIPNSSTQTVALLVDVNQQNGGAAPCSAPSAPNTVVICSPTSGANFTTGTINVTAASNVTNFVHNRLYLDNQDVYDTSDSSQTISTAITAGNGSHNLVIVSYNGSGQAFTSSTTFTVGATTTNGCIPAAASAIICSPATGSTTTTQSVTVTAGARAQTGYLTAMRVYIDNVAVYTSNTTGQPANYQFTQSISVNPGTHNLVVVAYESNGAALTSSTSFTSSPGPCAPAAGTNNLIICSPAASTPTASPVMVTAGANSTSGYIAAMRIYIDNNPVATINNSGATPGAFSIQQSVSMPSGSHNMVLVGYPSSGGYVSASETVVVP